ncbi:hypothetical protein KBY84_07195 [Cyanobium sp. N.Huapi 1H5]|uniref:hypothetical protein n=1 Tax=Cyanobium sp. N.Huapi 1H5 TaxID=2823719 RepID=UPI0020CE18FA|nr:hypothetical protein [Cyanobium sp. N.Huapi 1H5]MCP9837279.1 hypothetical protein [Cyanobium sp. N.Huapi 1H5]
MDALKVLNGFSSWLVERTGPNENSPTRQGIKLDVFATSMRVTKQIPANLEILAVGGSLTGGDVVQRLTDLAGTGLVERVNASYIITDMGRAVLGRWQALNVSDEDPAKELVRQAVLVDEGIRGGPPVYRAARDFWKNLVEIHPAEQWFANPLALYLVSYLNFTDGRGYNPWTVIQLSGASVVDITDAQWEAWADSTGTPLGWTRTTGMKMLQAARGAATRYVGRVNFCMALEARRRVLRGELVSAVALNWIVPHA